MEWGDSLIERFSAVVFLTLEPSIRMDRLKERETARYGSEFDKGFTASSSIGREVDDAEFSGRSRARHEGWLALLPCPVFRLDSAEPVARLLDAVTDG